MTASPRLSALVGQPAKFVLVGAGGYLVNLAAFAMLFGAGLPYVIASVAAYFISNALMYLGNRYYTFRLGHEGFWSAYLRYLVVGLVVSVLVVAVLALLVELVGMHPTLGQGVAMLVVTPVAFVLFKRWTFRIHLQS
jgi:putative flippase GtrA